MDNLGYRLKIIIINSQVLFHGNNAYANAPHSYVYKYNAGLVNLYDTISVVQDKRTTFAACGFVKEPETV